MQIPASPNLDKNKSSSHFFVNLWGSLSIPASSLLLFHVISIYINLPDFM